MIKEGKREKGKEIILLVLAMVTAAVYAPSKRMHKMEITESINEL